MGNGRNVSHMPPANLGSFLLPEGYRRPSVVAVLREASVVPEVGRFVLTRRQDRRYRRSEPYVARIKRLDADPVLLVPGFLAGDTTLRLMSGALRQHGLRTYRSSIHSNIGCTLDAASLLERRLESIAERRGSRVQVVGHSLGGMLARGLAVRRPDLVSRIVTMGSPMMAPGAHHPTLGLGVEVLVRLSRLGVRGVMTSECVGGDCARASFEESREPLPHDVDFTAIYSRRDGIVDWRACVDPEAEAVEVSASHVGMAVDPRVIAQVVAATTRPGLRSAVEVDAGVGA